MTSETADTFDVVVLGSGAAGLAAAATAAARGSSVLILEAYSAWGGTSALSGGTMWFPANKYMEALGLADTPEQALEYVKHWSTDGGGADLDLVRDYITRSQACGPFLDSISSTNFNAIARPEYRPESPGSIQGRTIETALFDPTPLGEWAKLVHEHQHEKHQPIRTSETWGRIDHQPGEAVKVSAEDVAERAKMGYWARGRALVGALLDSALKNGAELRLNTRATRLVFENNRVAGVLDEDGEVLARARRGVVIATGGFEWDADLQGRFLRAPVLGAPSPRTNRGDGLKMAAEVGAGLRSMPEAWWGPVIHLPHVDGQGKALFKLSQVERARPGCIMVDHDGRRFVNESHNYHDVGRAMQRFNATTFTFDQIHAFLVFDGRYRRAYGILGLGPNDPDPEWLTGYPTLDDLADSMNVDRGVLAETISRFNGFAAAGRDDDFQRGESSYDRYVGDATREGALKSLAELAEAPYYAIPISNGALGTNGGPEINGWGQVVSAGGTPIDGLYAAGNAAGNGFGLLYTGAGATLGPCLVWGFAAGHHASSS